MPDLLGHVLAAYLLKKAAGIRLLALFLLGTILPDILSRVIYFVIPGLFNFVKPMHSVIIIAIVCLLLSYFFPETDRKHIFKILYAGALLHLFLDSLQISIYNMYIWFFPITTQSFSIGLFWPEDPVFALPFLALISLVIYLKTRSSENGVSKKSGKKFKFKPREL